MTSSSCNENVMVIPRKVDSGETRLKVAVYCRVSTKSGNQEDSLENQIEYYEDTVGNDPRYELMEIYHDFGISGFKESRPGFQRMMEDARNGRFQIIITKSITRLARNTKIVLDAARELKSLGIGIYFELQNINTLSEGGELLMTLYAAFGQAESEANRVGTKMTVRRRAESGVPMKQLHRVYGYSMNENGEVVPDKNAPVVLMIYEMAADGFNVGEIKNYLNSEGIKTQNDAVFYRQTVTRILKNEEYKGDFVQMKHYIDEHRRLRENKGEVDRYYFENDHLPIVTNDLWEKAQRALNVRAKKVKEDWKPSNRYAYKDHLFCAQCGRRLEHIYTNGKNSWKCSGKLRFTDTFCAGIIIPDEELKAWKPIDGDIYISSKTDRGRVVEYNYEKKEEWEKTHKGKVHAKMVPELNEENYPYKDRIFCKYCGAKLRRIMSGTGRVWWICNTMSRNGKEACPGIRIPDEKLAPLRDTDKTVYIGKEIINGKECYGYSRKPDKREA